ncbi:hypothetical protein D3C87_2058880 [compost metagenome]
MQRTDPKADMYIHEFMQGILHGFYQIHLFIVNTLCASQAGIRFKDSKAVLAVLEKFHFIELAQDLTQDVLD